MSLSTLEAELARTPRADTHEAAPLYEAPSFSWEGTLPPSQEVRQELVRRALQFTDEIDSFSLEEEAMLRQTLADMEAARLVEAAVRRQAARPTVN